MLPPSLPAPPCVAVSADARLAYVLHHFGLAYPGAPTVSVGYASVQPQVEIAELGEAFFAANVPYPPAPAWRTWAGRPVPFFFDKAPEKPLLVLREDKAFISADIISAAFYLLSGWQEYFSSQRDQHGRFPYAASVQKKYSFVALPVVNYYFDVLKTAVEHVSGQLLQPRRWGSQAGSFAAFISHDVDNLRSGWKAPAKAALQQRKLGLFGKLLWQYLTQPDAWDNLEKVAAATAQYGAKSTFFMLPNPSKSTAGIANADYRLTHGLWRRLHQLKEDCCELGLHGSLGTATDASLLTRDLDNLQYEGSGIRFHYLSWNPSQTLATLDAAGFDYDSTLGFAEHFGFRNSFCLPFYPFNFALDKEAAFLEIPLIIMDATLNHPNYLQLNSDEVLPALIPVFAEIKKFGGVASVLWHNQNFDPANTQNGPAQFHEIMRHLQQQGAAFRTGREIWQEFASESSTAHS
jgi:peptidoglycan/xylan/chitin deacetylase (PgdA/CDA1 family)